MPSIVDNTTGWVSLLEASRKNDMRLVKQLVENGADMNYQHPDFLTSPMFEAIRHGHWQVVKFFADKGYSMGEKEQKTGMTALQLAISERQHIVVDFLMEAIPPDQRQGLRTILVTGHIEKELLIHLAGSGHVILVDDAKVESKLILEARNVTRNQKIFLSDMIGKDLNDVTHWILRECPNLLNYMSDYTPVMKRLKRCIILSQSSIPGKELEWLLRHNAMTTVLVEPSTLWDTLGDWDWKRKWIDSVWWIMATKNLVEGNVYNYQRREVWTRPVPEEDVWAKAFKPLIQMGVK